MSKEESTLFEEENKLESFERDNYDGVFVKFRKRLTETREKVEKKAQHIKNELKVIYIAYKRPDTPWYAKIVAMLVIGYALSPIDLIPDFIPVLGYLDDIILLPLGILLVIRLIPKEILDESREEAEDVFKNGKPKNWIVGIFIIAFWLIIIMLTILKIFG